MKKTFLSFAFLFLASGIVFAGCTSSTSEDQIRSIVEEELSGEEFDAKVEASIERFVQKQQEDAAAAQEEANKPKKVEGVSVDDDPVLGDPDAPVTIIEFSDYECPFCKRHFTQVYPQIKENYIDTGKVKLVFRDFPLDFHPDAIPAAKAANCARDQGGDEKYFEMHDKLFLAEDLSEETLQKIGSEAGLDETEFNECLASDKHTEEINKDMQDGSSHGVTGTPAFFINGWFIKGAYPYSEFEKFIEQELAAQ